MSSNDNLIVCADNNGKINDLFKVSPENIVGDTEIKVSPQYEKENFNKMSFVGSGEFTGIYYDDSEDGQSRGNNLGCRGVYVIGIYSETKGSILNKEVTLYLSDKQLSALPKNGDLGYYTWTDSEGNNITSLLRVVDNKTTTFDNSFYTDKASLISHLKTTLSTVTDVIKFSYTSNTHFTDSLQFVSFDETYCSATFKWISASSTSFNSIFANDPGSYDTEKNTPYSLRTYDTALFSYDMLGFGVVEIFPTGFAVGTNNTVAGDGNIATGMGSKAMGAFSAAFGRSAQARGYTTFAAGIKSKALNNGAFACGDSSTASGYASFAAGTSTASGNRASAFGHECQATGDFSHAEGYQSKSTGDFSHAEGYISKSTGSNSHAEGSGTESKGKNSHAEGLDTKTYSNYSHAEGIRNQTINDNNNDRNVGQHAEGVDNKVTGRAAHVGGEYCVLSSTENASPDRSFVHGYGLNCNTPNQTIFGKYNDYSNSNVSFMIGGGTSDTNRKNIFEVCADGSLRVPIFTAVPIPGSINKQLVDTGKRAGIWITTKVEGNRDPKNSDDIEIVYNVV